MKRALLLWLPKHPWMLGLVHTNCVALQSSSCWNAWNTQQSHTKLPPFVLGQEVNGTAAMPLTHGACILVQCEYKKMLHALSFCVRTGPKRRQCFTTCLIALQSGRGGGRGYDAIDFNAPPHPLLPQKEEGSLVWYCCVFQQLPLWNALQLVWTGPYDLWVKNALKLKRH